MTRMQWLLLGAAMAATIANAQEKTGAPTTPAQAPVSMCIGCHAIPGYHASFPQVYHVPRIGGQSQAYIEAALKAYKAGDRSHPTMQAIAKGLSDEQIAEVAAYYAKRGADGSKR